MEMPFFGRWIAGKKYLLDGKTLLSWLRAYKADRIIPGSGITAVATPQGRVIHAAAGSVAANCPLMPELSYDALLDKWFLSVSNGYVANLIPLLDGQAISSQPAPQLEITSPQKLYKIVDWTVERDPVADNNPPYKIASETPTECRFELHSAEPTQVVPDVDEDTGAVTHGLQVDLWAEVISDGDGGYILANNPRCGSHQLRRCGQRFLNSFEANP